METTRVVDLRADYALLGPKALYRAKTLHFGNCMYKSDEAELHYEAEVIIRMDATELAPILECDYYPDVGFGILEELVLGYEALDRLLKARDFVRVDRALAALRATEISLHLLSLPWRMETLYLTLRKLRGDIISRFLKMRLDTERGELHAYLEFTTNTIV